MLRHIINYPIPALSRTQRYQTQPKASQIVNKKGSSKNLAAFKLNPSGKLRIQRQLCKKPKKTAQGNGKLLQVKLMTFRKVKLGRANVGAWLGRHLGNNP